MAWQSSPKPDRKRKESKSVLYIALIGFIGLLMEVIGVWLIFSWFSKGDGNLGDPSIILGIVLAILGFVVLTRWLATVIKELLK